MKRAAPVLDRHILDHQLDQHRAQQVRARLADHEFGPSDDDGKEAEDPVVAAQDVGGALDQILLAHRISSGCRGRFRRFRFKIRVAKPGC